MAVKLDDRSRASAPSALASGAGAGPLGERRPGDTLPPTPVVALLAAGGADLLVLSTDPQLLDTARRASREQLPVWPVASWTELETALAVTRRAVVLVDAELLGDAARARIVALDAYSHKAVTLVAADRSTAQGLMGLLSERKIHRLLIKPPALGITRLLIDSALGRCLQLADAEKPAKPEKPGQPQQPRNAEAPVAAPPRAPVHRPQAAVPFWVFATAGAALLAGVAVIAGVSAWWRSSAPGSAPTAQAAPVDVAMIAIEPAAQENVDADPPGVRDLDHYLAILAADPTDAAARRQLEATVGARYAEAETALLANDDAAAAAALADVRRAEPTSTRLAFLQSQLERAQLAAHTSPPAHAEAPPVAPVVPVENTELSSLLTIARARIQRGQLLDPPGDGAREYVARAERLAPENADVAVVRAELATALTAAARGALAANDAEKAGALTAEARRRGAANEELAQLDAELALLRAERVAQRHAAWLAQAEARIRQGALVGPAEDNARHYLLLLENAAPRHAGLGAAWAAFVDAMTQRITAALVARDWTEAEEGLAALADAPNGAAAGEPLRAQLATAKLEERYLAVAAPASELELLERVPPKYPIEAQRRGVEGWVDVEFVVDVTGQPRDVEVVAAEPKGQFEEAALAALAEYRYRPFSHDGRTFARRVRLRIRFALQ